MVLIQNLNTTDCICYRHVHTVYESGNVNEIVNTWSVERKHLPKY